MLYRSFRPLYCHLFKYLSPSSHSSLREKGLDRSSHSEMFFKIGFLINLAIFTEKHLCWSLFLIKSQAFRPATLLKRDSTQVFSCEYSENSKNTFFKEHLRWLLLTKKNSVFGQFSRNSVFIADLEDAFVGRYCVH